MRLDDADISEKRVFIRADLNVPMQDGQISNDARIRADLTWAEGLFILWIRGKGIFEPLIIIGKYLLLVRLTSQPIFSR